MEFKDSVTGVHTNDIESDWQKIKQGVHFPRFRVCDSHLGGYLAKHLWRVKYNGESLFDQFLRDAGKIYDGQCKKANCIHCIT